MTAFEWTQVELVCNGGRCYERFEGERGLRPTSGETRARVRERAAEAGWTHVRGKFGRPSDRDFCPLHNPDLTVRVRAALDAGGWAEFSSRAEAGKVILNAPGPEGSWRSLVTEQCAGYLTGLGFETEIAAGSLYVSDGKTDAATAAGGEQG